MDTAKKSFEMQAQVRQNAEIFKNTLNELYSWEKEIKDKELALQNNSASAMAENNNNASSVEKKEHLKTLPVRSHVEQLTAAAGGKQQHQELQQKDNKKEQQCTNGPSKQPSPVETTAAKSPVEKTENPLVANEEKRKRANEVKDRGNNHVKLGEFEKARDAYSAAIGIFPEDAVYYSNRALCYLKLKRFNDCIEDCDRALEIDKFAVKAYYRRMQANESQGNNLDALKDCTSVLTIEPKNQEAKKSLERINEMLRKNVKSKNGPNFSPLAPNMVDILPIEKPAYSRSNKPLRRVPISDIVVVPKDSKNSENSSLKISDEDIDKLFNSNCGPFVEIKKGNTTIASETAPATPAANVATTLKKAEIPAAKNKETTLPITTAAAVATVKPKKDDNNNQKSDAKQASAAVSAATTSPTIDSNKLSSAKEEEKKKAEATATAANILERPLPPAPTSTAQFYATWKELSSVQKYQYLKSIDLRHLCKVLGAGFDSDTLTDILRTLRDFYLADKGAGAVSSAAATLCEVSKNKQVAILSLFMSTEDRKVLSEILNLIKEGQKANDGSVQPSSAAAATIAKNFNLT